MDLAGRAVSALLKATKPKPRGGAAPATPSTSVQPALSAGSSGANRTIEVDPTGINDLRLSYAPDRDGDPDAGEIVWTWVPYVENDGRGKDRPVLVVAQQSADRVYAVKLTSRSRDGNREYLPIGSGPWDAERRESWVDLDQLYSVHAKGMRREAAALDRRRFDKVAAELHRRYGWHPTGR